MKLYGSLNNRLEENKMFCKEIEVGTGVTEYHWSDRTAYEVVEVKDQKHVFIREYDAKHVGEPMTNNWELISNENNPVIELNKRGKYWYKVTRINAKELDLTDPQTRLSLCLAGFDLEKLAEKGSQVKYRKMEVSFGRASYYYDYEF